MTIDDLLLNKHYRGNQTSLAKDLNINRNTLRKYVDDKKGDFHFIVKCGDKYEMYTNQSNKVK